MFKDSFCKPIKRIIPARDPKQCCGVFLLEIVDAKSVSRSVHQNPVVLLLQDVFVRTSASAASRATCARSLYAGLLYRSFRISAPRSCSRTTCARSLYEDLLCKMFESGCLYEEPLGQPVQDLCMRISCARCLCQDLCIRIL